MDQDSGVVCVCGVCMWYVYVVCRWCMLISARFQPNNTGAGDRGTGFRAQKCMPPKDGVHFCTTAALSVGEYCLGEPMQRTESRKVGDHRRAIALWLITGFTCAVASIYRCLCVIFRAIPPAMPGVIARLSHRGRCQDLPCTVMHIW